MNLVKRGSRKERPKKKLTTPNIGRNKKVVPSFQRLYLEALHATNCLTFGLFCELFLHFFFLRVSIFHIPSFFLSFFFCLLIFKFLHPFHISLLSCTADRLQHTENEYSNNPSEKLLKDINGIKTRISVLEKQLQKAANNMIQNKVSQRY